MIRTVAKRYAKALMELAVEKKIVDKTKDDLNAFIDAVEGHSGLQRLFVSPVFTPEQKKTVISDLTKKLNLQPTSGLFIEHLAETGRIRYAKEVRDAFLSFLAEQQNRAAVQVTVAAPISARELAAVTKTLVQLTGKEVDIDVREDASLIGGVKAQIGSIIFDGTIRGQLDKMRGLLAK